MTESNITEALVELQHELPHIAKGNTADTGKFKYSYADLTDVSKEILPLLSKHGLAWVTMPTHSEHGFSLHYQLRHTSGELIEGYYPLPQSSPQEIGSAVTYARRYALCAVTGVAPGGDDDDAGKAQEARNNRPARRQPARDRINAAALALSEAKTLAELEKTWDRVKAGGLDGIAELVAAHEDMTSDLAGTEEDTTDQWAVAPIPGAEVPS